MKPMSKPRRANCVYVVEVWASKSTWEPTNTMRTTRRDGVGSLENVRDIYPPNKFRLTKYIATK